MPQFILSNANRRRWMLALALCFSLTATAQGLPRAKNPEEVGLSSERLKRLSETFKGEIGKGIMPGAVLLIARRGKVAHYEALGVRDPQTSDAMPVDAIFRLASMTKPMVSVAIMMLVEEGRMALTDPLSRYLPEFKNLQVGVEQKDASGETRLVLEPMRREMTIQDLLRHTAGLTYGQFGEKTLVKREYDKAALSSFELTTAEYIARLAKLPLAHQPGSTWDYSVATDVLGRVLEVVHGQDLDTVLRERVTRPLAMRDTGFSAPPPSHARIAEPFVDKKTGRRIYGRDIAEPPKRFGGGGGMVASAAGYVRFCQMLLNGGELDGVRLLSKSTVALMTANHLPTDSATSFLPPCTARRRPRRRWGRAGGWALWCAPTWARTRCTVRSANIIGTARPARRSGSIRRNK